MTDATRSDDHAKGAQDLAGQVGDAKEALTQKATAAADQLRTTVTERASAARDWASDQSDVLRDTVQSRPFIAIGVSAASAFAAGLVLGILLTRR